MAEDREIAASPQDVCNAVVRAIGAANVGVSGDHQRFIWALGAAGYVLVSRETAKHLRFVLRKERDDGNPYYADCDECTAALAELDRVLGEGT